MGEILVGVVGLAGLLFLIAVRVPIAYTMILVGIGGVIYQSGPAVILNQLKDFAYAQFSNYDLSVLPMFVLMGALASRCGLSRDLFRGANAWLGRFRGGVAMAAVAACAGFGAVCGSSTATASTMGQVALPELRRYRYSGALATGTIAAGGTLGILIPPSVVLIVYAIIVEVNIVTLFAAALIPGLLATVMFIAAVAVYVRLVPGSGPEGAAVPRSELIAATVATLPVLAIFAVVVGGIYAGIYSPTAAAAIGVVLVVLYGVARRRLSLAGMRDGLLETARTSGMIFLILLGAELLKIFMSRAGVPQATAAALQGSGLGPMASDDPDHPRLPRARLPDGQPVDGHPRHPVLLAGGRRARLRPRRERDQDLVRDHHPRRRRDRADHAPGRASTSSSSTPRPATCRCGRPSRAWCRSSRARRCG